MGSLRIQTSPAGLSGPGTASSFSGQASHPHHVPSRTLRKCPGAGRAVLALVVGLVILSASLHGGCGGRGGTTGRAVRVLKWRRSIKAGRTATSTDVGLAEVPASTAEGVDDVMGWSQRGEFARPVVLARDVRRGSVVRRSDIAWGREAASRPVASSPPPAEAGWRDLPVGEPAAVEAEGLYERYMTTTMTADAAELAGRRPAGAASPLEAATQPLVDIGLEKLPAEVPGVVVPAGARRLYGFRQYVPGGVADSLAYVATMAPAAAGRFYRTHLPPKGYRLVAEKPTLRGGGVTLTFVKDPQHRCYVTVYPADKMGNKAKIVLMIARPQVEKK